MFSCGSHRFQSYTAFIVHVAELAQQAGVEVLSVGLELKASTPQASLWRGLIASVRAVYSGVPRRAVADCRCGWLSLASQAKLYDCFAAHSFRDTKLESDDVVSHPTSLPDSSVFHREVNAVEPAAVV